MTTPLARHLPKRVLGRLPLLGPGGPVVRVLLPSDDVAEIEILLTRVLTTVPDDHARSWSGPRFRVHLTSARRRLWTLLDDHGESRNEVLRDVAVARFDTDHRLRGRWVGASQLSTAICSAFVKRLGLRWRHRVSANGAVFEWPHPRCVTRTRPRKGERQPSSRTPTKAVRCRGGSCVRQGKAPWSCEVAPYDREWEPI